MLFFRFWWIGIPQMPLSLKMSTLKAVGAKNPYGTGYVLDNGDYLTFGGDSAVFKEKIYIEMIMKFTNLQNYMSDEKYFCNSYEFLTVGTYGKVLWSSDILRRWTHSDF